MDVECERWTGVALDEITAEIDGNEVVGRQRVPRRRRRIDVERIAVSPCAAVTAVIHESRTRQHANRIDQSSHDFDRFRVRFQFPPKNAFRS